MGTLVEDIGTQSAWIVKAFAADGLILDYSIDSFIAIDKFISKHTANGKPKRGGRLSKGFGSILFSLGSYVGETIIKAVPGCVWITDDSSREGEINITVKLPDGVEIWPVQRMIKRVKNGTEDSLYVYGYQITKDFTGAEFNSSYWESVKEEPKPWWKIW